MSAQGTMLGLASSGVSALGSFAQGVNKTIGGIDKAMADKASATLKQKLSIRKQIKNKASKRMGKIGGNK